MNLLIFSILYLSFGFIASIVISYFILRKYPKPNVKFTYYLSILILGLVLFFIVLIPFDIATTSEIENENNESNPIIDFLPKYYLFFGYFSELFADLFCPFTILLSTTAYYKFGAKIKNIIKRFFTEEITHVKVILLFAGSIPVISNIVNNESSTFEIMRKILMFLKFFPYLKILFYIGFICQDLAYRYLRLKKTNWLNYNVWALGKIYKYYNREKITICGLQKKLNLQLKLLKQNNVKVPAAFYDVYKPLMAQVSIAKEQNMVLDSNREKVEEASNNIKKDGKNGGKYIKNLEGVIRGLEKTLKYEANVNINIFDNPLLKNIKIEDNINTIFEDARIADEKLIEKVRKKYKLGKIEETVENDRQEHLKKKMSKMMNKTINL